MNKLLATLLISVFGISFSSASIAATSEQKAEYKAAVKKADADYKAAKKKCDSMSGNEKDVCKKEAEDAHTRSKSEAKANYKNTIGARTDARKDVANADYKVAKEKCDSKSGNEKDICLKEADAKKTSTISAAKEHEKIAEARADAREDQAKADYKVAIEKCDAMSGAAKNNCTASVKSKYGK
jgi:hypothetical protein